VSLNTAVETLEQRQREERVSPMVGVKGASSEPSDTDNTGLTEAPTEAEKPDPATIVDEAVREVANVVGGKEADRQLWRVVMPPTPEGKARLLKKYCEQEELSQ